MFGWTRGYWTRQRDITEIAALSDGELADIGASRTDLMAIAEMPDEVPVRMAAMARVFGVDEARLTANRAEYVEDLITCAGCHALARCRQERARGEAADAARCGFCPNAGRFAALARSV